MASKPKVMPLATNEEIVSQAVNAGVEAGKLGTMIRSKIAGLTSKASEEVLMAIRTLCRCDGVPNGEAKPVKELSIRYGKAYSAITTVTSKIKAEAKKAYAASTEGKTEAAKVAEVERIKAEVDGRKMFSIDALREILSRFSPHILQGETYNVKQKVVFAAFVKVIAVVQ